MLTARNLPEAQAAVAKASGAADNVAVRQIHYIKAPVLTAAEQVIRAKDVEENPESKWRAGINVIPEGLENKIAILVQKELDAHDLYLAQLPDGKGLCLHTRIRAPQCDFSAYRDPTWSGVLLFAGGALLLVFSFTASHL